jgi:uncharacterized membrane protein
MIFHMNYYNIKGLLLVKLVITYVFTGNLVQTSGITVVFSVLATMDK